MFLEKSHFNLNYLYTNSTSWAVYEYDAQEKLVYSKTYDDGAFSVLAYQIEYDVDEDRKSEQGYNHDGSLSYETTYVYDENGDLNRIDGYSYDENEKYVLVYDVYERKIKEVGYDAEDIPESWGVFEYDETNTLTKSYWYSDETPTQKYAMQEYNADGETVLYIGYDENVIPFRWFVYEYDEKGKLLRGLNYTDEALTHLSYILEYDSNGEVTKELHYVYYDWEKVYYMLEYSADTKLVKRLYEHSDYWEMLEYDSAGNISAIWWYSSDGKLCLYSEHEPDERVTLKIVYNDDGNIAKKYTYEYLGVNYPLEELKRTEYDAEGKVVRIETLNCLQGVNYLEDHDLLTTFYY